MELALGDRILLHFLFFLLLSLALSLSLSLSTDLHTLSLTPHKTQTYEHSNTLSSRYFQGGL